MTQLVLEREAFEAWLREQGGRLFDRGNDRWTGWTGHCPIACYAREVWNWPGATMGRVHLYEKTVLDRKSVEVAPWATTFIENIDREPRDKRTADRCLEILAVVPA